MALLIKHHDIRLHQFGIDPNHIILSVGRRGFRLRASRPTGQKGARENDRGPANVTDEFAHKSPTAPATFESSP
jgi:hypothetical protein